MVAEELPNCSSLRVCVGGGRARFKYIYGTEAPLVTMTMMLTTEDVLERQRSHGGGSGARVTLETFLLHQRVFQVTVTYRELNSVLIASQPFFRKLLVNFQ